MKKAILCYSICLLFIFSIKCLSAPITESSLTDLINKTTDISSKELIISEQYILDKDLTLPASVNIKITKGGKINIVSGIKLTINGAFDAGLYKVFEGQGQIIFGSGSVNEVYPEWWGAKADYYNGGGTDITPYLYKAAASFGNSGGRIKLAIGKYRIHDAYMLLKSNQAVSIVGSGNTATQLWYTGNNVAFSNTIDNTIGFTHFKDFAILKYGFVSDRKHEQVGTAFNLQYCKRGCKIADVKVVGFKYGIITKHSYYTQYHSIVFEYNNYPFMIQRESNNISIDNCVFENSKTHITFDSAGKSRQISIKGNAFEVADEHYMIIRNCDKVIIDGNYIEVYNRNAGNFDIMQIVDGGTGITISNNYIVVPEEMTYTGNCINVSKASHVDIYSNLQIRKSRANFINVNKGSSFVYIRSNSAEAPFSIVEKEAVILQ